MANTFYLDMDGVVADFDTAAEQLLNIGNARDLINGHYRLTAAEWERLRTEERFYRHLPKMQRANDLVTMARKYRDELGWKLLFLTAVPKDDDMPWAFWDKCMWAQEHWPDISVHFGPHSTDKWRHCQPGDILVDDRSDNCASWREHRGMAFRVEQRSLDRVLVELEQDYSRRISLKNMAELNAAA